jgi:steroid 5-alpha reductase family enzyme
MTSSFFYPLLAFLGFCVAVMAVTWAAARKLDNYGIVDAVWAYCFTAGAILLAVFSDGWGPRRLTIALMGALWSLRLGSFLAKRIYSHHPGEDTRYQQLRKEYGAQVPFRFFLFFQMQAVSVVVLVFPFLVASQNTALGFHPLEWAGMLLWACSLAGEAVADHQMNQFKSNPKNKGEVCDVGLWRYSRHPNYFFESCIWWGFFSFALASPFGWASIYCPVIMLLLLLKVTGVPPSEQQSLRTRGEKYRAYQRRTSIFVPWFPKESK